jgi:hypothetical protein
MQFVLLFLFMNQEEKQNGSISKMVWKRSEENGAR